ncbi:MAG: DNA polymerase I, partial [Deltaproteobacteria bacterium]
MRDAERPVLHLIDGSGYIFRAYHALRGMWMRDGTPTHAVVGFAKMLNKLLRADKPTALGMAFDTGNKNFRHAIYPEYKANREAPPEDLTPQFPLIYALVEAMGIPILQLDGYEADDILATLARKAVAAGYNVVIVSGDKDLMQLVDDHVCIFDPMKD